MSLIVAYTTLKAGIAAAGSIKDYTSKAIGFCSDRRREAFLKTLEESVQIENASGIPQVEVDKSLNKLLSDDEGKELIFDSFRRVCLAKSKTYGPRIIALLTAEIISYGRKSEEDEDMVFAAAELLSDFEFSQFEREYDRLLKMPNEETKAPRRIFISLDNEILHMYVDETVDTSNPAGYESRPYPPNLRESHGGWATHLDSCGLISRDVVIEHKIIREDSERHIDEDMPIMVTKATLTYKPPCLRLFDLLRRAKGIAHAAQQIP